MKKHFKKTMLICGIICLLFIAILMLFEEKFDLTFFLWNLTTNDWVNIFWILAILFFGTLIIKNILLFKKSTKKNPIIFTITMLFCVISLSLLILCILFFGFGSKYTVIHSPNKEHTIVVKENSFLLAGYGSFYRKVNAVFITYIDSYSTDDGYEPFSDNNYKLDWKEDSLTITYGFGENYENGSEIKRKIKLDLKN